MKSKKNGDEDRKKVSCLTQTVAAKGKMGRTPNEDMNKRGRFSTMIKTPSLHQGAPPFLFLPNFTS